MAISNIELSFLAEAHKRGLLPQNGTILEFGEAESFVAPDVAIPLLIGEGAQRDELLAAAAAGGTMPAPFLAAKLIYRALFDFRAYNAIDLLPPADYRYQQDLNLAFDLGQRFDVCINNGTSEHVFNQGNCFKAMHDHTAPGGTMIHWTPCLGWIGHGLYNVQPSFFHDLAAANGYALQLAVLSSDSHAVPLIPDQIDNALLDAIPALRDSLACVVMRKVEDQPFRFPLQGVYSYLKDAKPEM